MGVLRLFTVLEQQSEDAHSIWKVRCDCGQTKVVRGTSILTGKTRSCGCLFKETSALKGKLLCSTHRMSYSPECHTFYCAKDRCNNPRNKGFKNYGGRGIRFLFKSFEQFYTELGPRPTGLTLDRIDNDGNYEPGNVRWATRQQQQLNQRRQKAKAKTELAALDGSQ